MPKAYSYSRVSTLDQAENGFSMDDQESRCMECYHRYEEPRGVTWGLHIVDPAISASVKRMFSRPGGQQLQLRELTPLGVLESGDVVIIDKIDRAWRSMGDMITCTEYWTRHGIKFRFREMGEMDTLSILGEMMYKMLAMFAEFESKIKSVRQRERVQMARKNHDLVGGKAPLGFKAVKRVESAGTRQRIHNKLVSDKASRNVMAYIVKLRDEEGLSWSQITEEVEQVWCRWERRTYKKSAFHKKKWSHSTVKRAYKAELRLRADPEQGPYEAR